MERQAVIGHLASDVLDMVERADECEAEQKKAAERGLYALALRLADDARRFMDAAQVISDALCKFGLGGAR